MDPCVYRKRRDPQTGQLIENTDWPAPYRHCSDHGWNAQPHLGTREVFETVMVPVSPHEMQGVDEVLVVFRNGEFASARGFVYGSRESGGVERRTCTAVQQWSTRDGIEKVVERAWALLN